MLEVCLLQLNTVSISHQKLLLYGDTMLHGQMKVGVADGVTGVNR